MVLVDHVPLLQPDLLRTSAYLGGDELLELEDGVGGAALYALALAEAIVCDDFDEDGREGVVDELALAH